MNKRVRVWKRGEDETGSLGRVSGGWVVCCEVWADVSWVKGVKSMREGALDAYDSVIVRMRWMDCVDRDCRVEWDGRLWDVESVHRDRQANTIQITAREITD